MGDKNSKYSIADVKQARGQARRGLLERQKQYAAENDKHDRRAVKRENWKRARQQQEEANEFFGTQKPAAKTKTAPDANDSVKNDIFAIADALANNMEASDRRKQI